MSQLKCVYHIRLNEILSDIDKYITQIIPLCNEFIKNHCQSVIAHLILTYIYINLTHICMIKLTHYFRKRDNYIKFGLMCNSLNVPLILL